jgi:hypothetical protein
MNARYSGPRQHFGDNMMIISFLVAKQLTTKETAGLPVADDGVGLEG